MLLLCCFWTTLCFFLPYRVFWALKYFLFYLFLSHVANQPESKVCIHGYLFPLPVALGQVPHPSYDATAGNTLTHSLTYRQVTNWREKTVQMKESEDADAFIQGTWRLIEWFDEYESDTMASTVTTSQSNWLLDSTLYYNHTTSNEVVSFRKRVFNLSSSSSDL